MFSGFLAGFAFYSYFVYLFFVPAFIVLVWYQHKKCVAQNLRKWLLGFLIGSSLYVFAYFSFVVSALDFSKNMELLCLLIFILLWGAFTGIPFYYVYQNKIILGKEKIFYYIFIVISGICTLCSSIYLLISGKFKLILVLFNSMLQPLSVGGKDASLLNRLSLSVHHIFGMLQNKTNETIIFSKPISIFTGFYITLFAVMTLVSLFLILKHKEKYKETGMMLLFVFLFICSFVIISIPFATRIGGHHFVATLYLFFILIGIQPFIIMDYFNTTYQKVSVIKNLSLIILTFALIVNFTNQGIFIEYLQRTGGVGLYSEQLNLLADKAVEHLRSGQAEVYVFPDWGFMMSFNFLTRNSVPYVLEVNEKSIKPIKYENKKAVLCYLKKEDSKKHIEQLQQYGMTILTNTPYYTRNGQIAFYTTLLNNISKK